MAQQTLHTPHEGFVIKHMRGYLMIRIASNIRRDPQFFLVILSGILLMAGLAVYTFFPILFK